MHLMKQPFVRKIFWAIYFIAILTSCTEKESQIFIFKRYNSEIDNWNYYKTDLYDPSRLEEISINPCFLGDKRIQPNWSPNGRFYGCSAVYDQPLVIYDTNNKVMAKLEQGNREDPLMWGILGWSPDSQYVSIMNTGSKGKPYYDFSIMKYDGSDLRQFNKQPNASIMDGEWSPDGKFIVHQMYTREHDYVIIFQSTGKEISRFDLSDYIHTPVVIAEQLKWSPDSRKLAFLTYYNMDVDSKLYVLDIESGEVKDIIPDESVCIMSISDWSPNGEKILFDAIDCEKHIPGDHERTYYSIKYDGAELQQLTGKGFGSLNWTLDGKSFIVSGYEREGIYLMDVDGSNKTKLLDNGYFVSWITP